MRSINTTFYHRDFTDLFLPSTFLSSHKISPNRTSRSRRAVLQPRHSDGRYGTLRHYALLQIVNTSRREQRLLSQRFAVDSAGDLSIFSAAKWPMAKNKSRSQKLALLTGCGFRLFCCCPAALRLKKTLGSTRQLWLYCANPTQLTRWFHNSNRLQKLKPGQSQNLASVAGCCFRFNRLVCCVCCSVPQHLDSRKPLKVLEKYACTAKSLVSQQQTATEIEAWSIAKISLDRKN